MAENVVKTTQDPEKPTPSTMEKAMDYLGVAGSFATMLMKRIPDFIDSNPVAMAFGLANAVIEITGVSARFAAFLEAFRLTTCIRRP